MADAKTRDFKPAQGDLPNTFARFGIDKMKASIKNWSDNNYQGYITIVSLGVIYALYTITMQEEIKEEQQEEGLSQFTEKISSMKTNLERSDISTTQVDGYQRLKVEASPVLLTKKEQEDYLRRVGVAPISREEKRMKVIAPDLDILDPDS